MTQAAVTPTPAIDQRPTPVLEARGLVKRYGQVTAMDGCDFELLPGEIMAVIGDNGAGKSTLIKALSGALVPDEGTILLDGQPVRFHGPLDARRHGIETVYQDLAVAPALDIADNLFLGRELRRPGVLGSLLRMIDHGRMLAESRRHMQDLKIGIRSMGQAVETLSGGQRQGVAVARSAGTVLVRRSSSSMVRLSISISSRNPNLRISRPRKRLPTTSRFPHRARSW